MTQYRYVGFVIQVTVCSVKPSWALTFGHLVARSIARRMEEELVSGSGIYASRHGLLVVERVSVRLIPDTCRCKFLVNRVNYRRV